MIVISNGMLRSGSTLQYNVAATVLESAGPLKRAGFLGDLSMPETRKKIETFKEDNNWTILKTHEAPLESSFYDGQVKVLFSYRDVRDIAASIKKKWGHPFEKILSDIDKMIEIEYAFRDIPNVLVQPYDTLFNDLPTATRGIIRHLGIEVEDSDFAKVVMENSIQESTKRIKKRANNSIVRALGLVAGRFRIDAKTQMHDDHISVSSGRDGDWVNQFNQQEIEMIEQRFAPWLRRHKYKLHIPTC